MVQFEELLLKLQALKPEIDDLSDALGMKGMLSEIQQLELKATEPGFWDDVEKSQKVLQRLRNFALRFSNFNYMSRAAFRTFSASHAFLRIELGIGF